MIRLVLLLSITAFAASAQTQVAERKNVERKPSPSTEMPVYYTDNVQLDARAQARYKQEDIRQMPAYKKLQVNNYYQKSYELFIPDGCDYNGQNFDVSKYEAQRKEDSRARVNLEGTCGAYVILHSRQEYLLANEKIKEESGK